MFPNQICTPVHSLRCSGGGSSCGRCSAEHCPDFLWQALLTSDAAGKSFLSVNSSFLGNLISCMTPCVSSFEAFQYSPHPQEFQHYWLSQYISAISLLFHPDLAFPSPISLHRCHIHFCSLVQPFFHQN